MSVSRYREQPPPPSLADRVVCLWTQDIGAAPPEGYAHRILPDGCADIVWIGAAPPVVAGPATRCLVARLAPGSRLIGVRFRPGWAASMLGLPVDGLRNQHVPLASIWGRSADRLTERVLGPRSTPARLRSLGLALAGRFSEAPRPDGATLAAIAWLIRHPAGRVCDLAGEIGLGERQLQRRLHAAVGYGPKTFQRVMRLQRVLALGGALAHRAADAGYADQAHMCREVRALSGQPPRVLLGGDAGAFAMSDLFKTLDDDHD